MKTTKQKELINLIFDQCKQEFEKEKLDYLTKLKIKR